MTGAGKTAEAKIRLAEPASPGASLYNSYHLVTVLASTYAHAADIDHDRQERQIFLELGESVIEDLGHLYQCWETVTRSPQLTAALQSDQKLARSVRAACQRAEKCSQLIGLWTSIEKTLSLTTLIEKRWQRLIGRIATIQTSDATLTVLANASRERLSRVVGIRAARAKKEASRREFFKAAGEA